MNARENEKGSLTTGKPKAYTAYNCVEHKVHFEKGSLIIFIKAPKFLKELLEFIWLLFLLYKSE